MRHLKLFLVAVIMAMSTAALANPKEKFVNDRTTVSYEINEMLKKSNLIIEKSFNVSVLFEVGEGKRIQVIRIKTENKEMKDFLMERLQNKQLSSAGWDEGKVYELPIRVEAKK